MKLKKTENNNIQLIEAGKVIKSFTPAATLELTQEGKAVGLFYDGANVFDFYPTVIKELEIAPDSATPFSGSVEDLLEELSNNFFFEAIGGAFESASSLILSKSYKVLGITSATLIESVELEVGFTYGFKIEGLAQRGTGFTGTFTTVTRQFGRTAGGSIAAAPATFASTSYSVAPSFLLVGNTVEVYAGVAGGIPINWNLDLKVFKIENT